MDIIYEDNLGKELSLKNYKKINYIKISLASEKKIRSWSHGEVLNSETLNYRTLAPEYGGLFCPRIFGPVKNYECACGKYKGKIFSRMICNICKVLITSSKVRRYRMGHIELASPVIHFWFLRTVPQLLNAILGISSRDINSIMDHHSYLIINSGISNLNIGDVITYEEYNFYLTEFDKNFIAFTGIKAIEIFLKQLDLIKQKQKLINSLKYQTSIIYKEKFIERIKIIENFLISKNSLHDLIINVIPVLPPELRPLVLLEGGKFANSDLNLLYRRIVNRNNRLKKLINISAPIDMILAEQKLLQESVNSLIDNEKSSYPLLNQFTKKPLKSISDILKGKHGRFRANLLGKRVDYSGRSVIVVGPDLNLDQCGLPINIAMELFKPFILNELLKFCKHIDEALDIFKQRTPLVYDIINKVIIDFPVLLNRAPTLHRLGIQAFYPILIEGNAIRLHPLVCMAFNADFDGDQMAVHIPITLEAREEAKALMLSTNNMLAPSSGNPILIPSQDIILGLYYLTKKIYKEGAINFFYSIDEVITSYQLKFVDIKDNITFFNMNNRLNCNQSKLLTTVGRVILYSYLPDILDFNLINRDLHKKDVIDLLKVCFLKYGSKFSVDLSNQLSKIGFKFSTILGMSISLEDLNVDYRKDFLIDVAKKKISNINLKFKNGFISNSDRYSRIINTWYIVNNQVKLSLKKNISSTSYLNRNSIIINSASVKNNVNAMIESGARGTQAQLLQLAGMRGLMSKPDGSVIEYPILSSLKDGLNVIEYFISTHGARKGLSDTSLKTANAGYLTRRLVDVSQDIFITIINCGTTHGLISSLDYDINFYKNIFGRFVLENVINPFNMEIIIRKNTFLTESDCNLMKYFKIRKIKIRSPIYCECIFGICAYCYGYDLSKNILIKLGESVGIIAAQSIGEPGTQLTMRTFHSGGANLITLDANKNKKFFSPISGFVKFINFHYLVDKNRKKINISYSAKICFYNEIGMLLEMLSLTYGSKIYVDEFYYVKKGELIAEIISNNLCVFSKHVGYVRFINFNVNVNIIVIKKFNGDIIYKVKDNIIIKPIIEIFNNNESYQYILLGKSVTSLQENQYIEVGDIICYITDANLDMNDITGGLTKISDLFEVRDKKNCSIFSHKSGFVSSVQDILGQYNIDIISSFNQEQFSLILEKLSFSRIVQGMWIERGDIISHGNFPINRMLEIKGLNFIVNTFIKEIQSVYIMQGIYINNKHFEIILKQMMKKCEIFFSMNEKFIKGDIVDLNTIKKLNSILKRKKNPFIFFKRKIIGITRSALATNSFISSASFQETSAVLANAAFYGKKDLLYGLKENVIIGNLIPSGTGYQYENKKI